MATTPPIDITRWTFPTHLDLAMCKWSALLRPPGTTWVDAINQALKFLIHLPFSRLAVMDEIRPLETSDLPEDARKAAQVFNAFLAPHSSSGGAAAAEAGSAVESPIVRDKWEASFVQHLNSHFPGLGQLLVRCAHEAARETPPTPLFEGEFQSLNTVECLLLTLKSLCLLWEEKIPSELHRSFLKKLDAIFFASHPVLSSKRDLLEEHAVHPCIFQPLNSLKLTDSLLAKFESLNKEYPTIFKGGVSSSLEIVKQQYSAVKSKTLQAICGDSDLKSLAEAEAASSPLPTLYYGPALISQLIHRDLESFRRLRGDLADSRWMELSAEELGLMLIFLCIFPTSSSEIETEIRLLKAHPSYEKISPTDLGNALFESLSKGHIAAYFSLKGMPSDPRFNLISPEFFACILQNLCYQPFPRSPELDREFNLLLSDSRFRTLTPELYGACLQNCLWRRRLDHYWALKGDPLNPHFANIPGQPLGNILINLCRLSPDTPRVKAEIQEVLAHKNASSINPEALLEAKKACRFPDLIPLLKKGSAMETPLAALSTPLGDALYEYLLQESFPVKATAIIPAEAAAGAGAPPSTATSSFGGGVSESKKGH